jgi:hypothetical protein
MMANFMELKELANFSMKYARWGVPGRNSSPPPRHGWFFPVVALNDDGRILILHAHRLLDSSIM